MTSSAKNRRLKTAVLISGRGTNMTALIEAAQAYDYPASIDLVISNRPDAGGIEIARGRNIDARIIDHTEYKTRRAFETELHKALVGNEIELVCCAGFMRVLTPWFVKQWAGRLINIHPSLLPKYKGLNTHKRVLEARDTEHGCTVHWVTADLDSGDMISQARIAVLKDDTEETLANRVLSQELILYPQALLEIATLRILK